jgi:hypothetical protein
MMQLCALKQVTCEIVVAGLLMACPGLHSFSCNCENPRPAKFRTNTINYYLDPKTYKPNPPVRNKRKRRIFQLQMLREVDQHIVEMDQTMPNIDLVRVWDYEEFKETGGIYFGRLRDETYSFALGRAVITEQDGYDENYVYIKNCSALVQPYLRGQQNRRTVQHEFGHCLDLAHTEDEGDLMFPSSLFRMFTIVPETLETLMGLYPEEEVEQMPTTNSEIRITKDLKKAIVELKKEGFTVLDICYIMEISRHVYQRAMKL